METQNGRFTLFSSKFHSNIYSIWNDHWSIMKPAYFIIWFSFNNNFRFSIKWYSRAQKVIWHKYVKYTCSMETVQQNGRFTPFSISKFHSNIYSILYGFSTSDWGLQSVGRKIVDSTKLCKFENQSVKLTTMNIVSKLT